MSRLSIFIDIDKCSGCYNCFLACRDEYYGNDYLPLSAAQPLNDQFWMQIREVERGVYPKPKLDYVPMPCLHCESAPCVDAAPEGAVYRRPDGIVIIDPQKAKDHPEIVNSCPYRVIFWNPETRIPQKCTMCAHRLDEGAKQPRCVESCPTGALVFGDLDDPDSEIAGLCAEKNTEELHPEYQTSPLVKYAGIPKRFVAGEVVLKDKQDECAAGVSVTLEGDGVKEQTATDLYGDFEFDGLAKNKSYKISIALDGYQSKTLDVVTQKDINLGEVVLDPK
jgi:Fe-S-cluster-containing dehydrogenase component